MPPLLLHGLASAEDLPVPFGIVLWAVGAAVLGATVVRLPRRGSAPPGHGMAVPPRLAVPLGRAWVHTTLQAVMLVLLLAVLGIALLGALQPGRNPAPRLVYGVFWPLLTLAALVAGSGLWRSVNPLRLVGRGLAAAVGDPAEETTTPVPARLGIVPGAVLLALFLWSLLALPEQPRVTFVALTLLVGVTLAATVRHGRAWLGHGDPWEVYATALGALAPLGRDPGGVLRLRSPRRALAEAEAVRGLGALAAVVVGADLFEGLLGTLPWQNAVVGEPAWLRIALDSAGFLACVLLAGAAIHLALRRVPDLSPALLPAVAAYALAHALPVLLVEAQVAVAQLSDPLGRGWDLFGVAASGARYDLLPDGLLALVVAALLLAGHVAAVVVARDRAERRFSRGAGAAQLPLRALLVASALVSVTVRLGGG